MKRPTISVIIPAYNAAPFLAETLDSVLTQTFQDWVAVVINDGSTDQTEAIATEYARRDPRIKVINQTNKGLAATRNVGMAAAPADYFAFVDADDIWLPQKLEHQLACAQQEGVSFVFCGYQRFGPGVTAADTPDWDRLCKAYRGEQIYRTLVRLNFIIPSCVLLSSRLIDSHGGFDEELRSAEDWDMWLRLARAGHAFFGTPNRLCRYRYHSESLSASWDIGFWNNVVVLRRHLPIDMLDDTRVRNFFRLIFRNTFTVEGDRGRFDKLLAMFETYRVHDPRGNASHVMAILAKLLPTRPFWFISRYLVIPLAWHMEALGERLSRRFLAPSARAENE